MVDERTEDTFTVPASEMERFFYSFSTLHCLAVSMQDGGAGTGTVIRADTVRGYAARRRLRDRRGARRRAPAVRAVPDDVTTFGVALDPDAPMPELVERAARR